MTDLDEISITGLEEYPADCSVKLNGPPGTGKTTESAARVAKLLQEYDYELNDVLWATYRRSLAMETLQRLSDWGVIPESELAKPRKGDTRYIHTIHAVANRLVGGAGDVVGYGEKRAFAQERGLRFDKRNAWDQPPGQLLFDVFSYAANNLLDLHKPSDRDTIPKMDDLRNEYRGDIAQAWDSWQDFKAQNDKIDFWEQLMAPIRKGVTPNQDVVVIDEYHDATPLMAKLAESWINQADVAIVAGDPLQVVNTYAGAHPKFYKRVDLPEIQLPTAWERPPIEHWKPATQVLANAHSIPDVEIDNTGSFHEGQSPTMRYSDGDGWSVPDETTPRSPAWIVDEFGEDTMFLTRTQKQAGGIARALEKAGILFETQSTMDVADWGARDDMAERTALYNALQRLDGVKPASSSVGGLAQFSGDNHRTPDEIRFRHAEASAILDHASHKHLSESRSDITEIAEQIENDETVVKGADLEDYVEPEFWRVYGRGPGAVRHLNKSHNRDTGESLKERDFEALQRALKRNDEPVKSVDTLVYTIHASKGSEAKNVVVYDGITKRIQESMRESEDARRNEYRTWYVALTRSRANLFLLRDGFEWTISFLPENLLRAAQTGHKQGVTT